MTCDEGLLGGCGVFEKFCSAFIEVTWRSQLAVGVMIAFSKRLLVDITQIFPLGWRSSPSIWTPIV